jgi:hypothetical protein
MIQTRRFANVDTRVGHTCTSVFHVSIFPETSFLYIIIKNVEEDIVGEYVDCHLVCIIPVSTDCGMLYKGLRRSRVSNFSSVPV